VLFSTGTTTSPYTIGECRYKCTRGFEVAYIHVKWQEGIAADLLISHFTPVFDVWKHVVSNGLLSECLAWLVALNVFNVSTALQTTKYGWTQGACYQVQAYSGMADVFFRGKVAFVGDVEARASNHGHKLRVTRISRVVARRARPDQIIIMPTTSGCGFVV
jgi:hypothetical protein